MLLDYETSFYCVLILLHADAVVLLKTTELLWLVAIEDSSGLKLCKRSTMLPTFWFSNTEIGVIGLTHVCNNMLTFPGGAQQCRAQLRPVSDCVSVISTPPAPTPIQNITPGSRRVHNWPQIKVTARPPPTSSQKWRGVQHCRHDPD